MGRRNRRREDEVRPLSGGYASRRTEGDFIVQNVSGAQAVKPYVCPGCNQRIAVGTSHVVVWSQHRGPDDRRHWHSPCWSRARHSM
ncbi:MAG: hypothetical protein R2720_11810 [Candidatus Nanopelagicales bacterium]